MNAIIFILFYALFGYCNNFELTTADIARIGYSFQTTFYLNDPFDAYQEGGRADIYSSLIFYYLIPFTHNPKIFCAVVGLIYGILSYLVFVKVYDYWPKERNGWFYVYILVLISNISLVQMTGVRFFTAGLLFVLSALNFVKGNKLWIIGVLITYYIHFSLLVPIIGFIAYALVGKFFKIKRISYISLIITFIISFLSFGNIAQGIVDEAEIENKQIQNKIEAYTEEEDTENHISRETSAYREANNIFTQTFFFICKAGLLVSLLILLKRIDFKKLPPYQRRLLELTIALTCCSFVALSLTIHAIRYVKLAWCVFLILFPLLLKQYNFNIKKWDKGLVFANLYSISFLLINAPRLVNPQLWYMNLPNLIMEGLDFRITWFVY